MAQDRLAVERKRQFVFAHAARLSRRQHDRRDSRRRRATARGRFVSRDARSRTPGGVFQQSPDAHRPDLRRADGLPRHHEAQDMVEAVELGRAGAAGHSDDRNRADRAQSQQIAGIDRHPEMLDRCRRPRRWRREPHPAGRRSKQPRKSAPDRRRSAIRRLMSRASASVSCARADIGDERAAKRLQPLPSGSRRLVENARLQPRRDRLDQRDAKRLERRDAKRACRRLPRGDDGFRRRHRD